MRSSELLLGSKSFSETLPENEKVNRTLKRVAKSVLSVHHTRRKLPWFELCNSCIRHVSQ